MNQIMDDFRFRRIIGAVELQPVRICGKMYIYCLYNSTTDR